LIVFYNSVSFLLDCRAEGEPKEVRKGKAQYEFDKKSAHFTRHLKRAFTKDDGEERSGPKVSGAFFPETLTCCSSWKRNHPGHNNNHNNHDNHDNHNNHNNKHGYAGQLNSFTQL
jgi:hypothetical protein